MNVRRVQNQPWGCRLVKAKKSQCHKSKNDRPALAVKVEPDGCKIHVPMPGKQPFSVTVEDRLNALRLGIPSLPNTLLTWNSEAGQATLDCFSHMVRTSAAAKIRARVRPLHRP
jgi:hypothetical protein